MCKIIHLLLILPLGCLAQITISGKVLNQADRKPLANVSVFLNNTGIGIATGTDGSFVVKNVKPGQYQLVARLIGFEPFSKVINVSDADIMVGDIILAQKAVGLNEVKITFHHDPNREKYLNWFTDEFFGASTRARDCKILNPDILDLSYDEESKKLTASSDDFLEIENDALGYEIKYLLINFSYINGEKQKIYYEGPAQFHELKGSPSQERRWQRNRLEVYQNSPMHFLRAALSNRLDEENFRVQLYAIYPNPDRPADSLINAKISYYQQQKQNGNGRTDSLSYWTKKSNLPVTLRKLIPDALHQRELIRSTDKPGEYALIGSNGSLFVSYSASHHFHISDQVQYLYNPNNFENTLINFNQPIAFFNQTGIILNPYSVEFSGVWGRSRVAELLPVDYEPPMIVGREGRQPLLQSIDSILSKYLVDRSAEKAYLHFDKPYYAAGDTIYFKAYVTASEQHKLSNISGILHVDLVNTKDKTDQSIKLQLEGGISWGDFALPDTLPAGNYRIRAYTRWMRNEGENDFFEKTIAIGAVKPTKIPESMLKQPGLTLKPDIQFLPEGGNLIADINTKVAFKATGSNGLGVEVKGIVVDNNDKQVASFTSTHLGMGSFNFTPTEGSTYSVKITWPNGLRDIVNLPKALNEGITMSVNNESLPKATVNIKTNPVFFKHNKGKAYILLIYSGGLITTVDCQLDSPQIKLDILKRRLHTGVATLTLFSSTNEPLCERLFFVQNYDQLSIDVSSNKGVYSQREKVNVKVGALNRKGETVEGHFSVAVVDEATVQSDVNADNILSYLLLTSDLKGYIEHPNYYFADTSVAARQYLDNLMLTQGYRRFEWKQVQDTTKRMEIYQPEKSLTISGRVDNLSNKPVANGAINLIPSKSGNVLGATTDDKGLFSFTNLLFTDTAHFVLSAVNNAGKNTTKITWFDDNKYAPAVLAKPLPDLGLVNDTAMTAYIANDRTEQREVATYINHKAVLLKQVNIHATKRDNDYRTQSLAGPGNADQVMHAEEIEQIQGPLVTSLNGRLHGVVFAGSNLLKSPYLMTNVISDNGYKPNSSMQIVIDGAETTADNLNFLSANDVETVEVLKYASASMYGVEGGHGVLVITTKLRRQLNLNGVASVGVLPLTLAGFYKARQFYSPKYETPAALVSNQRDLRSTIYWNPEIKTDINGNALFSFYNSDGTGTYKVIIEGIDNDGNIGRQVLNYEVK